MNIPVTVPYLCKYAPTASLFLYVIMHESSLTVPPLRPCTPLYPDAARPCARACSFVLPLASSLGVAVLRDAVWLPAGHYVLDHAVSLRVAPLC